MGEYLFKGSLAKVLSKSVEIMEKYKEVVLYLGFDKNKKNFFVYKPKQRESFIIDGTLELLESYVPNGTFAVLHPHKRYIFPTSLDIERVMESKIYNLFLYPPKDFLNLYGSRGFIVYRFPKLPEEYSIKKILEGIVGFLVVSSGKLYFHRKRSFRSYFLKFYEKTKKEIKEELVEDSEVLADLANLVNEVVGREKNVTKLDILMRNKGKIPEEIFEEVTQPLERRSQGSSQ